MQEKRMAVYNDGKLPMSDRGTGTTLVLTVFYQNRIETALHVNLLLMFMVRSSSDKISYLKNHDYFNPRCSTVDPTTNNC